MQIDIVYSRQQMSLYKCTVTVQSLCPAARHSLSLRLCICLCLCRSEWTVLRREECCTRQWPWWRIAAPSSGTWPSPWTGTLSMSCLTIRWGNALILLQLSRETPSGGVMWWVARPSFSWRLAGSSPCDSDRSPCWHVLVHAWSQKFYLAWTCTFWEYFCQWVDGNCPNKHEIEYLDVYLGKTHKLFLFSEDLIGFSLLRYCKKKCLAFFCTDTDITASLIIVYSSGISSKTVSNQKH